MWTSPGWRATDWVRSFVPAAVALWGGFCWPVLRADTVYLIPRTAQSDGLMKIGGQVTEYTGQRIEIVLADGSRIEYPGTQVARIDTQRHPAQLRGRALCQEGRIEQALEQFRQAHREEKRPWLQREILADAVLCYEALGQFAAAGNAFLTLWKLDPSTPHLDTLPAAWYAEVPAADITAQATRWLRQEDPAAALLGASHLLASSQRAEAIEVLKRLVTHDDPRLALLAEGQRWRVDYLTATADQVRRWEAAVLRLPEPLRLGPYLVLGQAWAHLKRPEKAALAYLRVPILYPHRRRLAARALYETGVQLERAADRTAAAGRYRELLELYPESPYAPQARSRLDALAADAKEESTAGADKASLP